MFVSPLICSLLSFKVDKFCLVLQLDCKCYKMHLYFVHIILCLSLLDCVWFTFDFVCIGVLHQQVMVCSAATLNMLEYCVQAC